MSRKAGEGRHEPYNFLKQADLPLRDEKEPKGTEQVIRANEKTWGDLWLHVEEKRCEQAQKFVMANSPWANLTEEAVKFSAQAFSPSTAFTDGLPPKAVAMLSEELLERLAGRAAAKWSLNLVSATAGNVSLATACGTPGDLNCSDFTACFSITCISFSCHGSCSAPYRATGSTLAMSSLLLPSLSMPSQAARLAAFPILASRVAKAPRPPCSLRP